MDIPRPDKADYFDYYDVTVSQPLPAPGRGIWGWPRTSGSSGS